MFIRKYLFGGVEQKDLADDLLKILDAVVFSLIVFPERENRDSFDYLLILKRLKSIHFNGCVIHAMEYNLEDIPCFYQNCTFHNTWLVYDSPLLENVHNVLYQLSTFKKRVSIYNADGEPIKNFEEPLFYDCCFEEGLEITDIDLSGPVFSNSVNIVNSKHKLKKLIVDNCKISKRFECNEIVADVISLNNTRFNDKFELKNSDVEKLLIINCNFDGVSDFFNSHIKNVQIQQCIFDGFTGFEKVTFGEKTEDDDPICIFKFVTFLDFVNFRETMFTNGVDLSTINTAEPPNFLGVQLAENRCNRETLRIIKYAFEKQSNQIEALKFHRLEMLQYDKELSWKDNFQSRFILNTNKLVSDFGQSFIRPVVLIFLGALLLQGLLIGLESNLLYQIYPPANHFFENLSLFFNGLALGILPFSKFLIPGMEFISLLFYILFLGLIWQTITSFKRLTKR